MFRMLSRSLCNLFSGSFSSVLNILCQARTRNRRELLREQFQYFRTPRGYDLVVKLKHIRYYGTIAGCDNKRGQDTTLPPSLSPYVGCRGWPGANKRVQWMGRSLDYDKKRSR